MSCLCNKKTDSSQPCLLVCYAIFYKVCFFKVTWTLFNIFNNLISSHCGGMWSCAGGIYHTYHSCKMPGHVKTTLCHFLLYVRYVFVSNYFSLVINTLIIPASCPGSSLRSFVLCVCHPYVQHNVKELHPTEHQLGFIRASCVVDTVVSTDFLIYIDI